MAKKKKKVTFSTIKNLASQVARHVTEKGNPRWDEERDAKKLKNKIKDFENQHIIIEKKPPNKDPVLAKEMNKAYLGYVKRNKGKKLMTRKQFFERYPK